MSESRSGGRRRWLTQRAPDLQQSAPEPWWWDYCPKGKRARFQAVSSLKPPNITKSSSLALFVWLEKVRHFFIRMARNVPKVIFSITIVEEYKPSGRFLWEAVILSSQHSAILNTD